MENRIVKRLAVVTLGICLCLAGVSLSPGAETIAKSKPKLSDKTVSLAMGGTQTIRLKGGNGKWSISDEKVLKIKKSTKKSVTVAPVKAGTSVVSCTVGNRKLTCKVKVLNDRIGSVEDLGNAWLVGDTISTGFTLKQGDTYDGMHYRNHLGKITVKSERDEKTGKTSVNLKIKAVKAGRFSFFLDYTEDGKSRHDEFNAVFVNGFRGKTKVKKTASNYAKWRKQIISSMVSPDMGTWEIVDAIGKLISTGRYGYKGGTDGMQLWYGGNGTCVSGAKMMNDFMKDLGIKSKVHFAGKSDGSVDIYGNYITYMKQHKNTWITLGGKRYELNPQPEFQWPIGTVER